MGFKYTISKQALLGIQFEFKSMNVLVCISIIGGNGRQSEIFVKQLTFIDNNKFSWRLSHGSSYYEGESCDTRKKYNIGIDWVKHVEFVELS